MKGLSVIIPTLNRTDFLIPTLHDILRQQVNQPYEIIVVDQSQHKDQQVITLAGQHSLLYYYHIDFFRGLPEARNYGAQKAQYDILVYIDDDIECKPDFLQQHWGIYQQFPNVGVVAGGITEKFSKNIDGNTGKFDYWFLNAPRAFHMRTNKYVDYGGGGNFSVKKEAYYKAKGVDEHLTLGAALYEESDFCLRIKKCGYKVYFNFNAHVFHLAAPQGGCRVKDINKYIFNLGRNRTIIIERYLKWYHKPTAYLFMFKLFFSYAFAYRKILLLKIGIEGIKEGLTIGKQQPKISYFTQ